MISLINHDFRVRSQWGRYNLPRYIYIYYIYINPENLDGIYVRIVMSNFETNKETNKNNYNPLTNHIYHHILVPYIPPLSTINGFYHYLLCVQHFHPHPVPQLPCCDSGSSGGRSAASICSRALEASWRPTWIPWLLISKYSNNTNIIYVQCEAPKISKLVYKSNNYGLWYL